MNGTETARRSKLGGAGSRSVDDQEGALLAAEEAGGDGASEHAAEQATPVGTDDDQVGVDVGGDLVQAGGGVAAADPQVPRQPKGVEHPWVLDGDIELE